MKDLPIILLEEPEEVFWPSFVAWCRAMLFWIGISFLAIVGFIGAGYWWGKLEIRLQAEKIKPEIHRAMQPDCGSCRKGTNHD